MLSFLRSILGNAFAATSAAVLMLDQTVLPGATTVNNSAQTIAQFTPLQNLTYASRAAIACHPALPQTTTELRGPWRRATLLACASIVAAVILGTQIARRGRQNAHSEHTVGRRRFVQLRSQIPRYLPSFPPKRAQPRGWASCGR